MKKIPTKKREMLNSILVDWHVTDLVSQGGSSRLQDSHHHQFSFWNTNAQIHKYTNTQIQKHKYKYTNTEGPRPHKTPTDIPLHLRGSSRLLTSEYLRKLSKALLTENL